MAKQVLQLSLRSDTQPNKPYENQFLNALRHIEYGHLTIITPEQDRLEFSGINSGAVAMISVEDWGVFEDLVARGENGFAEAYINGRWDTSDLTALLNFGLVNSASLEQFFYGRPFYAMWLRLKLAMRENTISGSHRNIMQHYDLGNDFYSLWLDESMTYSCALFEGSNNRGLEEAQQAKYERILSKLEATAGDHILDIGCGWGAFAEYAAKQGMKVTAVTISPNQAEYARQRIIDGGLAHLVSIKLCDYRQLRGTFDYVVSIGMFEHVGEKYWGEYFATIKEHLRPGGRAMVQTITIDDNIFERSHNMSGFIETYIFPGGMLPSKTRFEQEAEKQGLICHEKFEFGQDYAITLDHWLTRFELHKDDILKLGYDDRFIRLWRFYLSSCIASFTSHRTSVMQAELTHPTLKNISISGSRS